MGVTVFQLNRTMFTLQSIELAKQNKNCSTLFAGVPNTFFLDYMWGSFKRAYDKYLFCFPE